jgi:methylated-DNA-[protein]-cysteine S-methyltransferase
MSRGIEVATIKTPIGPLTISEGPDGLVGVDFDVSFPELALRLERRIGRCTLATGMFPAAGAIQAYFQHRNFVALETLKVAPMGTPFQRQVWAALRTIPPGTTISYGELATRLGRPTAMRAVGAANGDNPVSIVVPCHRVIGQDGSLVGYGGGIERKRWLLAHEGAILV